MKTPRNNEASDGAQAPRGDLARFAWKEQAYPAPSPSRKKIEWKASAILGLQWLAKAEVTGHPVTVVVPAIYNVMPAEVVALGWFNEIDALTTIRQRMVQTAKLTGWDLFTFHTRHNLDSYYASTIAAVQETWLSEGTLKPNCVAETLKQYGPLYEYNRVAARLVESLVFQSSIMGWLNVRAEDTPLRFHAVGTSLISALVWSGAMSFDSAVKIAMQMGSACDAKLTSLAEEQLKVSKTPITRENVGWLRFRRIRQIMEGGAKLSLRMPVPELPPLEAPSRPFWFSATASSEPGLIATVNDVRAALHSVDLASWSPALPKRLPADGPDRIHGWLVSPMHPAASACRWSVYNHLLSTPASALLFLDHIAALGRRSPLSPHTEENQERFRVARMKTARL